MRINAKRTHRLSFRTEAKSTQTKHDGLPAPHIPQFFFVVRLFAVSLWLTCCVDTKSPIFDGALCCVSFFLCVFLRCRRSHFKSHTDQMTGCMCAGVQTTQFESKISVPADFTEHMEERVHPHALVYSSFNLIFRSCFNHQACSAIHVYRTFACIGGGKVWHEVAVSRSLSRSLVRRS